MKKFISFVSFVLFVSIIVTLLPLSALADESGNSMSLDIPASSFYNASEESAEQKNEISFSESISDKSYSEYYGSILYEKEQGTVDTMESVTVLHASKIPNGIYAFKNMGIEDCWMDIQENMTLSSYQMQHNSFDGKSPADTFTRSALFKVTQVGDTGRYVIRSMLNNLLSITCESDGIYTKEIPSEDKFVPEEDTYYINYDETKGGYTLQPYGSSQYVCANNVPTDKFEASVSCLCLDSKNPNTMWSIEKVVEKQQWGATLRFDAKANTNLVVGKTTTIKVVAWSCDLEANAPYLSIDSDSTRTVIDEWNSQTATLSVHPIVEGNMNISVAIKNGNDVISSRSITLTSELIVPEGFCIIRNFKLGGYIQLDNDAAPNYENGAILETGPLTGDNSEIWYLQHYADGYYIILSNETGCAVSVPRNQENTANVSIVQLGCSYSDRQLWKFDVSSSGNYIIRPKSAEAYSTDWCLSISSWNMEQPIYQKAYTSNNDYADEWMLKYIIASINLNVIFDSGYNTRHSNAITRISNELLRLKSIYLAEFGILVNYGAPTQFTSYGDECPNKPNGKCACTTDENCYNSTSKWNLKQYHHTNFTNIMLRIEFPNMDESFTIAYIGYDTCKRNEHGALSHYGIAYSERGLIGIANHKDGNQGNSYETKTLVHELGHIYGVIDHYDTEEDDDNVKTTSYLNQTVGPGYRDDCIYGLNKEFVADRLPICEGCRRTIEANSADFNHN